MANLWNDFKNLFPKPTTVIGTVTSINLDYKTSTVSLSYGKSINVKGVNVPVDSKCIIENGIIVQELPDIIFYNNGDDFEVV